MENMSYCRFHNTLGDLQDCEESEGMYHPDVLSKDERDARKRLVKLCIMIAREFDGQDEEDWA